MRAACVIPARMGSSRFPGKPLALMLGMPLILHVWHRCRLFDGFERVVVATCDREIAEAAENAGAEAVMTSDSHERATDRTEEAIAKLDLALAPDDLVMMVQGDEVLTSPEMLSDTVSAFGASDRPIVNLASRLYSDEDANDPNTVKVVSAPDGRALYYSRSAIPSAVRGVAPAIYQQTGIMGFRNDFLHRFSELPQTHLEQVESVDMMRVIEHGYEIQMTFTETETIGVDTPEELSRAEQRLRDDPFTKEYLG